MFFPTFELEEDEDEMYYDDDYEFVPSLDFTVKEDTSQCKKQ